MRNKKLLILLSLMLVSALLVVGCGEEEPVTPSEPQQSEEPAGDVEVAELTYVGSESCATCHSSEYEGWSQTAHPYMIQTADEGMWDISREMIEAELAKGESEYLEIGGGVGGYISSIDEILYVTGHQWKQRFVVKTDKGHTWIRSQVNPEWVAPDGTVTEVRWSNYGGGQIYEDRCLACHATGFDFELSQTIDRTADDYRLESVVAELGVGCESCHGPASDHVSAPSGDNIVNPANFTPAEQMEACGSCHARNSGHVDIAGRQDPIGFEMGMAVRDVTKPQSILTGENIYVNIEDGEVEGYYDAGGTLRFWEDAVARSHRMQYNMLEQNTMKTGMGLTCASCHDVHDPSGIRGGGWEGLLEADLGSLSCSNCHDIDGWDIDEAMPFRAQNASGVRDMRDHTFGPQTIGDVPEKE